MPKRRDSAIVTATVGIAVAMAIACASASPSASRPIGFSEPAETSANAQERRGVSAAANTDGGTERASATRPSEPAVIPRADPSTGDGRVSLPDGFPPGTRSLEVKEVAHVLGAPTDRAPHVGKIVRGTRVAWQRLVAPDPDPEGTKGKRPRKGEPCLAWVEIRPSGWLCRTLLTPSHEEPQGDRQPILQKGRLWPDDYFKVMTDDTKTYKTVEDVRAGVVDKLLSTKVMLVATGAVHIDDAVYMKTDHGLIEAGALGKFWPSDFAGLNLREKTGATWPFAWVFFERGGRKPHVYAEADGRTKAVRDADRRELVPVLEEQNGFVRVGDAQWIERRHLRFASRTPPPAQVSAAEQWIDVNLDEQVLVAYEGEVPVFATLVATGGSKKPTPVGTYRVRAKAATTPMDGDPSVPNRYEVSAVPWAIRFADGLFVHGVYWHDGFGGARSHGCVNVSPRDAAFLYQWIAPPVPDGWSEVEVPAGEGVIVRIRDEQHPNPPLVD